MDVDVLENMTYMDEIFEILILTTAQRVLDRYGAVTTNLSSRFYVFAFSSGSRFQQFSG